MQLEPTEPFELIETMLCTHRIVYLDVHLERLQASARFFDIPLPIDLLRRTLKGIESALNIPGRIKIRLTVKKTGESRIQVIPIQKVHIPHKTVCISPFRVESSDVFFHHKTTRRSLYNNEYNRIAEEGFYDVLFLNENDHLTEGSRTTIFLRIDGCYYTPPLACGVLPGVYRQVIRNRCPAIEEKILTLHDLKKAERVYLSNAITGLQRIHHIDFPPSHEAP